MGKGVVMVCYSSLKSQIDLRIAGSSGEKQEKPPHICQLERFDLSEHFDQLQDDHL
jgi:hypothetical protein